MSARLLCDRAERFLNLAEGEEGEELNAKMVALKESLRALRGALKDHEHAIIADQKLEAALADADRPPLHRRTSCRRKVITSKFKASNQPSLESEGVVQGGVESGYS